MTESFIKTYTYDNGEIQRVQVVTMDSFEQLHFCFPKSSERSFATIVNLYRNFAVPKAPWLFGRMVLIYSPELSVPMCDLLRKSVRVTAKGRLRYRSARVREFCEDLIARGRLEVVCGSRSHTKLLPVGDSLGYLSETRPDAKVRVNSNFFIMDCFEVTSGVDRIGTPIGLMVENGTVLWPPAFEREALLVGNDGSIEIRPLSLSDMVFTINGVDYSVAKGNVTVYERPATCRIPRWCMGKYIVISGRRVEGVYRHGGFSLPCSGFVLKVNERAAAGASDTAIQVGDEVAYKGLEDVRFGAQVANSIIVNGKKTTGFISPFYQNLKLLGRRVYPPSLYPMDYDKSRAPRIALGAMKDGRPCILWAEGPKKTGYVPGEQSCGASLLEMTEIAADLGLWNAVNLDGGGSAQILFDGRRELMISDVDPVTGLEEERAIPAGIVGEE